VRGEPKARRVVRTQGEAGLGEVSWIGEMRAQFEATDRGEALSRGESRVRKARTEGEARVHEARVPGEGSKVVNGKRSRQGKGKGSMQVDAIVRFEARARAEASALGNARSRSETRVGGNARSSGEGSSKGVTGS
jgi:hypothetical protein